MPVWIESNSILLEFAFCYSKFLVFTLLLDGFHFFSRSSLIDLTTDYEAEIKSLRAQLEEDKKKIQECKCWDLCRTCSFLLHLLFTSLLRFI